MRTTKALALRGNMRTTAASVCRTCGLFFAYGTLTRFAIPPVVFCAVICFVQLLSSVTLHSLKGRVWWRLLSSSRAVSNCLLGALDALLWWTTFAATVALHPFRVSVGEFFVSVAFVTRQRKFALPAVVNSLILLSWASNLTATHSNRRWREDQVLVSGNVSGMLILALWCVGDALRGALEEKHRCAVGESDDRSGGDACVRDGASLVMTLVLLVFVVGNTEGDLGGASGIASAGLDALLLVVAPMMLGAQPAACRGTLRFRCPNYLLLNGAVAFALHTMYHRHYRDGSEEVTRDMHPVLHIDNVVVLASAALLWVALHFGSAHSPSREWDGAEPVMGSAATLSLPHLDQQGSRSVEQRRLTIFLALTVGFMLVELVYGLHSNSLSLVSDSFHMLLDAASVALGLVTSVMVSWHRNERYPNGYARFEVLSGLANGVVLILIAVVIFLEAVNRFFDPPELEADHLLAVAVGGLLVNVVGVLFFHDCHTHGHSHGDTSRDKHGHSHGVSCCSHDSAKRAAPNSNLYGVYLHILADLLGSVAVIVSAVVVRYTGWHVVDPICSAVISLFIFVSAAPLVEGCIAKLAPVDSAATADARNRFLAAVRGMDGVTSVCELSWGPSAAVAAGVRLQVVSLLCAPSSKRTELKDRITAQADACGLLEGGLTVELL